MKEACTDFIQLIAFHELELVEAFLNAVKHGVLSRATGGKVWLNVMRQDDGVLIQVKDDGKGIPPEVTARFMDATMRESSGIGLVNTHRRLMQLYGTGLSIESDPGEGTTVFFVVPLKSE